MAQIMQVLLSKGESPNLGFRLQGGKDFGTPLVIQKVNGGSPAEKAGLIAGDAVIKINNTDVFNLRHKDAQDVIIRSGHSFEITVQRGGSIWKPSVQMEGNIPSHKPQMKNVTPVTKTSLAARNQSNIGAIGTGHNINAKPFAPQVNGSMNGSGPRLVNKQYNSPVGLYSDESIKDTLSAQTEVLATGALGVNFKKNEKNFDVSKSAVLSILQEAEKEPSHYETEPDTGIVRIPSQAIGGLRHVTAPDTKPAPAQPQLPPGQNICADCERLIVGVFVRIKDKNLHVECFKCSTCGSSLKNVGYYNINNKLYCDVHAKLAARNNPPAPNLVPVTIPPGSRSPSSTISASLGSHSLPSPAPLSPRTSNTSAAPFQAGSHFNSPRPFASVNSPVAPIHNINNITSKAFAAAAAPSLPSPTIVPTTPGSFSAKPGVQRGVGGPGAGNKQAGAVPFKPNRGRGVLNVSGLGTRVALCGSCYSQIRGPFITALGKIWCPEHFICATPSCRRPLQDLGFVEEQGKLYCEFCFEQYLAPNCAKCNGKIKADCLRAIQKHFHPECFKCTYCSKLFGNTPFFLEDGLPYCQDDWNELFTTKCFACGFPVEAGDRWVEALNNNYHTQCFNCSMCKKNLEGQSFFAKGGRPFCKNHAR